MEILNVVRFDGLKNRDWIIFKHFSEKIILGSQLIVQEGQVAIFVKGGEVTDVFSSGTYTLSTQNLPILSSLINLPFGSKTPFSAEIYFVNKAVKMELYWGTTDPIQLIDPKFFVKLNVRAFGQMGIRIVDPVVFFKKLIGGMQTACLVQLDKIKDFFKGVIIVKVKSAIADAVITKKCSALEISIKLEELSQTVSKHVSKSMEDYGISLVNFYIQSVNFPSEDFGAINKILEDRAAIEIMGDRRYATKRTFDVYEGAANNTNGTVGSLASCGIGLGVGLGLGSGMGDFAAKTFEHDSSKKTNNDEFKTCISCGAQILINCKFCPECGANNDERVCECGCKVYLNAKFCPQCGRKF